MRLGKRDRRPGASLNIAKPPESSLTSNRVRSDSFKNRASSGLRCQLFGNYGPLVTLVAMDDVSTTSNF
jgi:hypothetical protein